MLVQYRQPQTHPMLRKIAITFRICGWIGFWAQLTMVFLSGLVLLLAMFGQNFSPNANSGTAIGIFWAICGIVLLTIEILFDFRYVRIAKSLLHEPGAVLHPKRHETLKFVRWGTIIGVVGMVVALFGAGASVGVLVAKTVSQPPGVAIVDPNKIVRALDVFVVLANLNLIAAHLIGTAISFWLIDRIHHYRQQYHYEHLPE